MIKRKIKDENELLIEHEKFLQSRKKPQLAATPPTHPIVSDVHSATDFSAFPSVFSGEIRERTVKQQVAYDSPEIGKCGFPLPFHRTNLKDDGPIHGCKKSIFAREMERKGKFSRQTTAIPPSDNTCPSPSADTINYLSSTGPQTVTGSGLGIRSAEVHRIHQENLQRLSQMSREEILKERERLLSSMSPSTVAFLLHKTRSSSQTTPGSSKPESTCQTSSTVDPATLSKFPMQPDPNVPHMDKLEPEKLQWTLDLPPVAKNPPHVNVSHQADTGGNTDVAKESSPSQARFDLSGQVIPPEANLDTHLGLHHHGDEPERAGYTIGELFHLARSSMPAQRRIALSTLADALGQSRQGLHVPFLAPAEAPSLIYSLLSSNKMDNIKSSQGGQGGVAFLLRWCLDESVSNLTSVGQPAGGPQDVMASGASLSLVVECIRGLANLLCDVYGHVFHSKLCEYPKTIRCNALYFAPGLGSSAPTARDDDDVNHCEVMTSDPVWFLFTYSHLSLRLAWLLGMERASPRCTLPPDVAGLWIPALLIRGVRHSTTLAYRIFQTPNLFKTLLTRYLPKCNSEACPYSNSECQRPVALQHADGVPLPGVLELFRLTLESSPSIRLTMVNDFELIQRCCHYIDCSHVAPSVQTLDSLVAHLPHCLPLDMAVHLQVEALRCLSSCLTNVEDFPTPIFALNHLWQFLPKLLTLLHSLFALYTSRFSTAMHAEGSAYRENELLISLLTAWIQFLCGAFEAFDSQSKLMNSWSKADFTKYSISFEDCCQQLLRHNCQTFNSTENIPFEESLPYFFTCGVTTSFIGAILDSVVRILALQDRKPEHLNNLWNKTYLPLFTHHRWVALLDRFFNSTSILTGTPRTLLDLDATMVPQMTDIAGAPYTIPSDSAMNTTYDWKALPLYTAIDPAFLTPVQIAPRCLPDFGARVFFRYLSTSDGLANFSWPPLGMRTMGSHHIPDALGHNTSIIPLVASLITTLDHFWARWRLHLTHECSIAPVLPLLRWIHQLSSSRPFPWLSGQSTVSTPILLTAVESQMFTHGILLLSELLEQSNPLSNAIWEKLHTPTRRNLLYSASLRLLPVLAAAQRKLVEKLLSHVIFNPRQVKRCFKSEDDASCAKLISRLPAIEQTYKGLIFADNHITVGKELSDTDQTEQSNYSVRSSVPRNWIYVPFTASHQWSRESKDADPETTLQLLTNGLEWIRFLQETEAFGALSDDAVNPLGLLVHLDLGCLAYSEAGSLGFGVAGLLLAKLLHSVGSMTRLVERFVNRNYTLETVQVPPMYASYYDLYIEVVEQFTALSYNSPAFANLILWPCQQLCHMKYRRALWGEHQSALVAIRLRVDQVLLPISNFLEPSETDESVLKVYASGLVSGRVNPERQPVLFLIALHHLNRHLYDKQRTSSAFTVQFAKLVQSHKYWKKDTATSETQSRLVDLIRLYKQPNFQSPSPSVPLLPKEELRVGIDDPLVDLPFSSTSIPWECYTEETWPAHRKDHWHRYFSIGQM